MASLKVKRRFSDLYNSGSPDQRTVSPTVSPSTCSSFRLQSLDGGNPQQQQKRFRPASPQQQTSSSATNSTSSIQSPSFPRPNTPFEPLGSRRILGKQNQTKRKKKKNPLTISRSVFCVFLSLFSFISISKPTSIKSYFISLIFQFNFKFSKQFFLLIL